jgi:hypothetical protein
MKKFLKLQRPPCPRELPPDQVDAMILAAGAMKARRIRMQRNAAKLLPALGISAAAAAAAVFVFLPVNNVTPVTGGAAIEVSQQPKQQTLAVAAIPGVQLREHISKPVLPMKKGKDNEMLNLGDTTELEQENFNMAVMSDFSVDSDNFSI